MSSGEGTPSAKLDAPVTPWRDEWEGLQLRIARRADELARGEAGRGRRGAERRFWLIAEREIIGPASRVALGDLLALCARFSGRRIASLHLSTATRMGTLYDSMGTTPLSI